MEALDTIPSHRKGLCDSHAFCWLICSHEISSYHEGSRQFRLSRVLAEHKHLIVPPPTVGSLKEIFWEKIILSKNSWFSVWILFPQGWLFQHQARKQLFLWTQFPNSRKNQLQPPKCRGCWRSIDSHAEHRQFHAKNGYFAPFCWAEIKVHAGGLTGP